MNSLQVVQAWQDAVNRQDIDGLLEYSTPDIEIVGPRGAVQGHEILRQWLSKAGLHMTPQRYFAQKNRVVVAQRGVWRSLESGEVIGDQPIASAFQVSGQQIAFYARYDDLETALNSLGLEQSDEITESSS